ncbi:unnamed protein product [Mycena citricolor]|uniref:OPT oligopeptide transporter n=1 Tax=Mycena citricolor TaxID=2018698 RepID=A0AAD2GU25_9AGAR|nr:unnamed protein product [Mycena citricolor]
MAWARFEAHINKASFSWVDSPSAPRHTPLATSEKEYITMDHVHEIELESDSKPDLFDLSKPGALHLDLPAAASPAATATSTTSTTGATTPPLTLRRRNVPDVPRDVSENEDEDDFLLEHLNDPNLDLRQVRSDAGAAAEALELTPRPKSVTSSTKTGATPSELESGAGGSSAVEWDDESPYAEVRMAVSKVDDPTMPVNTFRMWFLGLIFTVVLSALNQVFEYRCKDISFAVCDWARGTAGLAPCWEVPRVGAAQHDLCHPWVRLVAQPGSIQHQGKPISEHVCITTMINVAYNGAIATDVLATQQTFFHERISFAYQVLLILGTQTVGFALGGLLRQFVVYPSSMLWPTNLVSSALFNTLHTTYGARERGHMTRQRFFALMCAASFVWYWVPGVLVTSLSFFTWACWLAPNDVRVNALFGGVSGLGYGIVSFDWTVISFFGSPLATPWWSTMNVIASVFLCFWIVTPIIYFSNTFFTSYLPLSSFLVFDNTGAPYNTTAVIVDGVFDAAAYEAYSPVFLSSAMCVGYFVAFATFASLFSHVYLWHGRDVVRRFRSTLHTERDVHSRLMRAYPEVPFVWYAVAGALSAIYILVAVTLVPGDAGLPIWAALLALLLASLLALPLSIIKAITNQSIGLNVMEEILAGYLVRDRPVANMIFKATCLAGTQQATSFAGSLKLGHYMKIPPRTMFAVQMAAVVVTCVVVTGVNSVVLSNVPGICTDAAPSGFVCPSTHVFSDAALLFGGIGPARILSGTYRHLLWGFPLGLLAPLPLYHLARRFPRSPLRFVNFPVFFGGVAAIPAVSAYNYAAWGLVAFVFNFCVRRAHFRWWMRYNYLLSAGMDAGLALASIVVFFAVALPGVQINWIGNTIWMNTADARGLPLRTANGTFGPATW